MLLGLMPGFRTQALTWCIPRTRNRQKIIEANSTPPVNQYIRVVGGYVGQPPDSKVLLLPKAVAYGMVLTIASIT